MNAWQIIFGVRNCIDQGPKREGEEGIGGSPGALHFLFRGDRSPIASLLGALTLFYFRGRSPKY